jgi:hypothetical protein
VSSPILESVPLGFQWPTVDPFLFCVHHLDRYPAGNERLGPEASLEGREIGQDFAGKDGWRMYHGEVVPGFPQHPHRGFETVTIARQGFIDHSDSLGATARYGRGDVQWLTAGAGIVHAEMFPLIDRQGPNTCELFQIWLNLPRSDKMAPPHFTMFWSEDVPRVVQGGATITIAAGALDGTTPLAPPPHSWASRPDSDLAIWTILLEPGAEWTLPPARGEKTRRVLYFFEGGTLRVAGQAIEPPVGMVLAPHQPVPLSTGERGAELLLLQGAPIAEPVAQYGPFVMNTRAEIQAAFEDYQRTRFGGWPWPSDDPVHPRDAGRFARHAGGEVERR